MKISIKLSEISMKILLFYTQMGVTSPFTRKEKVLYSIMYEISEKVRRFSLRFLNNKKPKKLTLKVYEADVLERYLQERINGLVYPIDRPHLLQIIGELNQQLA